MANFKRNQLKYVRKLYKIGNWCQYSAALINRGSLSLLVSDKAIQNWNSNKTHIPGKQRKYSDLAIESAMLVRAMYKLPLRQTIGFLESIFSKLGLDLDVPHYSTLSRRGKNLKIKPHKFTSELLCCITTFFKTNPTVAKISLF